ncbi:MAG TPA: helicase-related protein [Methylomirabilota bacterium]|nr:helicase-related protein [Methylomirabilota bacterium]
MIVTTNALGLGIDVPDIRVVVHVGFIKKLKLKNYSQESGQAGQDRARSEAIIMLPIQDRKQIERTEKDEQGWVDIQEFIQGNVCQRVILDQVMDGQMNQEACEEGEEQCDICQEREEESRRQVVQEQIIRRLDEGCDDSGMVLEEAGSEVSFDQGFQQQAVSTAKELEFNSQEQQRG